MAIPEGYERATGVQEGSRQCMKPGCYKFFRVANEHEVNCPHCGSDKTRKINDRGIAKPAKPTA